MSLVEELGGGLDGLGQPRAGCTPRPRPRCWSSSLPPP